MRFTILSIFKPYVWGKIQEDLSKGNIPSSDAINYLSKDKMIVTASWEIIKNVLTSDLDISVFIEGLVDEGNKNSKAKLDIQLSIQSQNDCQIEPTDVSILNWDEVFDAEYDSLPDIIQDAWNK